MRTPTVTCVMDSWMARDVMCVIGGSEVLSLIRDELIPWLGHDVFCTQEL